MRTLVGRLSAGLDESEFDNMPVEEVLGCACEAVVAGAPALFYTPPGASASPAAAQALADAQARLAAAQAALAAERQIDQTLGPMGILQLQQQADAAAAAAAAPAYDDGSGDGSYSGTGASSALDAFRDQGVDPFADDDVLGADVEDSDVDLLLDGLRHDRASRHRGAAYLETDD
jgi:hypothetical protein